jgi:hypothetical protein
MKTFTKCIYKNEMQCKIRMQVKMLELSLGKNNPITKKWKTQNWKLKQKN